MLLPLWRPEGEGEGKTHVTNFSESAELLDSSVRACRVCAFHQVSSPKEGRDPLMSTFALLGPDSFGASRGDQ